MIKNFNFPLSVQNLDDFPPNFFEDLNEYINYMYAQKFFLNWFAILNNPKVKEISFSFKDYATDLYDWTLPRGEIQKYKIKYPNYIGDPLSRSEISIIVHSGQATDKNDWIEFLQREKEARKAVEGTSLRRKNKMGQSLCEHLSNKTFVVNHNNLQEVLNKMLLPKWANIRQMDIEKTELKSIDLTQKQSKKNVL